MPSAEIILTNLDTSQTRSTTWQASSDFVLTQLLPGNFKVSVAAKGFRKYEQTNIVLTATERVVLGRIDLEVGELTQTIKVQAQAARLKTDPPNAAGLSHSRRSKTSRSKAATISAWCGRCPVLSTIKTAMLPGGITSAASALRAIVRRPSTSHWTEFPRSTQGR